ncbi:MAG: hypothetical protein HFH48_03775 [Lachnospiraceae bacterium]|nr:hypothetical protein [Lachnospiraceae bacterium]
MDFRSLFIDKDKIVMANMELGVALNSLDEAIVLNQLNYWIERNKDANRNFRDGHYWVYNSYEAWRKQDFPVWSATKIKRIFTSLEGKGIVLSANYNKLAIDKTKWYTIDYDKLKKFIEEYSKGQNETSTDQDEISKDADDQPIDQNDQTLDQSERALPNTNYRDYSTENTNRDLHTDTTKAETLSKDNDEADTISLKKSLPTPAKKKTKSELMELEADMCRRFVKIGSQYDVTDTSLKNIVNAFARYSSKFTERTGKIHPILKDETLEKIFVTLATISDTEYSHFENVANYEPDSDGLSYLDKMVDEHFRSEHGGSTDWHISHFARPDYLEKMAQHIVEW